MRKDSEFYSLDKSKQSSPVSKGEMYLCILCQAGFTRLAVSIHILYTKDALGLSVA